MLFGRVPCSSGSALRIAPKALGIPELLNMVISYAEQKDCVAAAQVARMWTSPALDRVWSELPLLAPLFGFLGELENFKGELVRR